MKIRIMIAALVISGGLIGAIWSWKNQDTAKPSPLPTDLNRLTRPAKVDTDHIGSGVRFETEPVATSVPEPTSGVGTRSEQEDDALGPLENPTVAPALAEEAAAQPVPTATDSTPPNRGKTEPVILTDYRTFTAVAETVDEKTTNSYGMRGGMALATPDGTWVSGNKGELAVSPDGTMTNLYVAGDATIKSDGARASGDEMNITSNRITILGSPRLILSRQTNANQQMQATGVTPAPDL